MVLLTWVDYFLTYRVSMATVDFKKDFARLLIIIIITLFKCQCILALLC